MRSSASTAASAADARPDVRPRDPAQPRRADHVGKRGHRVRRLQSAQGLAACRASATCSRASLRASRRTWELQENGRAFPPNYLHEAGAIICIGTASWRVEARGAAPRPRWGRRPQTPGLSRLCLDRGPGAAPLALYSFAYFDGDPAPCLDRAAQHAVAGGLLGAMLQADVAVLQLLGAERLDGVAQPASSSPSASVWRE